MEAKTGATATAGVAASTSPVYTLVGTLLEACSCNVLCPCWIGENPDRGTCEAFVAYHFDKGQINDVDVSGLSMVNVCKIPGNVLVPKSWRVFILIDDRANGARVRLEWGRFRAASANGHRSRNGC